jgi:hydrogenase maturation protease
LSDQVKKNTGESNHTFPHKITILGIGNVLLSDEGIGVHITKELNTLKLPPYVEVIEGGTDGFGLLNIISDTDFLIVIDALKGGSPPGTFYKFKIEDAPQSPDLFKTSIHQIGILEVLNLSSLIGKTPETIVFGIEPKKITAGLEISPEIKKKVPRIIELVQAEIERIVNNISS